MSDWGVANDVAVPDLGIAPVGDRVPVPQRQREHAQPVESVLDVGALVTQPAAEAAGRNRAGAGERGVLGQESVTGVNGLGPRALDHLEQLVDVQVGLRGRSRAEQERLVGAAHVERVAVRLGVHANRRDAHLAERAHDADGDLAPVGDQDLGEHAARKAI